MEKNELAEAEWSQRAREAGLNQVTLAALAGVSPNSVYRAFAGYWSKGLPGYLRAIIAAWEIMSVEQRWNWMENATNEKNKPYVVVFLDKKHALTEVLNAIGVPPDSPSRSNISSDGFWRFVNPGKGHGILFSWVCGPDISYTALRTIIDDTVLAIDASLIRPLTDMEHATYSDDVVATNEAAYNRLDAFRNRFLQAAPPGRVFYQCKAMLNSLDGKAIRSWLKCIDVEIAEILDKNGRLENS